MMTRIVCLYVFVTFIALNIDAQRILSQQSKISVLTCSQGDELYAAFGHTALRVSDAENNIDWVFNYGTFDFNTPNFYLKFANGKLNYILSISKFEHFLPEYFRNNRTVTEQILNLPLEDRQSIFNALMVNYRPENRKYKYDFFYDNCATRIVDMVADNIKGELVLETEKSKELSFREYLHHYLVYSPWIETGLNLLLGLPADKKASLRESTYLPDFLMEAFDRATISKGSGVSALVGEKHLLLDLDASRSQKKTVLSPVRVCWAFLLSVLVLSIVMQGNSLIYFDRFLFLITGLVGMLMAYLWLFTDHSVPANNLNILWAVPTFVYLAFSKLDSKISMCLIYFNLACLTIFLLGWKYIPQSFPLATIPLALLLVFRLYTKLNANTKFI
ncbi:lipoprotein N-acyltransferase Lnb domain-containing protein [Saccharicrinis sp. GN24d3]|uniref:lipoprotein N-acyltransferase Lnb domain-containing protein n=1 Tax=Saccharicrinis sp. GN24d3 TaxID=3458416 RepID=UPI004035CE74